MPLSRELLQEIEARRSAEAVEADRDKLRAHMLTTLQCVLWCALGICCVAWSFHTSDEAYGRIAFYGGLAIGNAGWIFTALAAYRRGERRGDW